MVKNGRKIDKICKNQGFWHFDQSWLTFFTWKSLQMIIILFYFISCSVRWRKRARSSWKISKNCWKIGKIFENQDFWDFDQNWLISLGWKWIWMISILFFFISASVKWLEMVWLVQKLPKNIRKSRFLTLWLKLTCWFRLKWLKYVLFDLFQC